MADPQPEPVRIVRRFPAPVARVWRAWTEADVVRQWFGSDPAGVVSDATLDVRPGGKFAVSFADADGTTHTCCGVYAEVVPGEKLAFSWQWQSEPGHESFVRLELEPVADGTRMSFAHGQLGRASAHDYAAGWQRTFAKLERVLARNA